MGNGIKNWKRKEEIGDENSLLGLNVVDFSRKFSFL